MDKTSETGHTGFASQSLGVTDLRNLFHLLASASSLRSRLKPLPGLPLVTA